MDINYRKRAKGGYYAYATMPEGHVVCVIVEAVDHYTPNAVYRLGWYAKYRGKTTMAPTRKEAVVNILKATDLKDS